MKNRRPTFFILMSIFLAISGLLLIAMCVLIIVTTASNLSAPKFLIIASAVLSALAGILAILSGITGLNKNRRTPSKQCLLRARLIIIFSIISTIFVLIISIKLGILLILLICGIIVPLLYIISIPAFVDRRQKKA